MTLATGAGIYNSFDRGASLADTAVRDVSPLMFAALNTHPGSLLSMIATEAPVTNRKHEWVEQSLNPSVVTTSTGSDTIEGGTGGVTFNVASAAEAALVKIGDLLKNKTQNIPEIMQVTDKSSTALTVTRGYGYSVASSSHAASDKFEIMPVAQEGSSIGLDQTRDRTTRYNWTSILDTAVIISRTMMNTSMYNVPDEFQNSLMNRTIELKNKLNYSALNSVPVQAAGAPSSGNYGSMAGIIPMLMMAGNVENTSAQTGTNIDSSTTTLTYDSVSDLVGVCAVTNGNRDGNYIVAVGMAQYEVIATWPDSQVRRQYSATGQQYGGYVDTIMTKQGIPAKVVLEPDVPIGHLLVLDTNRIKLRPLANSAMLMYVDELGFNGNDYKQARLVAEWTLEMHNAELAHGIMNALT